MGFEKIGDKKGLASVLSKMRWVQNFLGNYESAVELAMSSLRLNEELGDEPGQAMAYTYLAESLYPLKKYDEMVDYLHQAYAIQKRLDQKDDLAYTAQLLSDSYLRKDEFEKSLKYANESLDLRRKLRDEVDIALSLNTRGNVLKFMERYEEALNDYRESMATAQKTGFTSLLMSTMSNTADVYNRIRDYRKALPLHLKIAQMVKETGEMDKAVENYMNLADAYAGIGKYDSAFFYQKLHTNLGDSLFTEASNARVSELQTKYESAKKEATIAIQKEKIDQQQLVQWFSFGAGALLLVVAGLLYWGYRTKQRNNEVLQQKNDEIALLLKEIHHRVKNNLQIIASLLNLQSSHVKDETALDAMRESKTRVESMSLIHQKLYSTDNLTVVEMQPYLHELGDTILQTFGIEQGRVVLKYQVDPIALDVDTAIPLGLIINELVTNSLKYAFPDAQTGEIEILLKKEAGAGLLLRVSDNGKGLSEVAELGSKNPFGTSLVRMLSKKMKGVPQVETSAGKGIATTIRFEKVNML